MKLTQLIRAIFQRKPRKPADIEKFLSPSMRARLQAEVEFLRGQGVAVRALSEGETPGEPRAADPAVEAMLVRPVPSHPPDESETAR